MRHLILKYTTLVILAHFLRNELQNLKPFSLKGTLSKQVYYLNIRLRRYPNQHVVILVQINIDFRCILLNQHIPFTNSVDPFLVNIAFNIYINKIHTYLNCDYDMSTWVSVYTRCTKKTFLLSNWSSQKGYKVFVVDASIVN